MMCTRRLRRQTTTLGFLTFLLVVSSMRTNKGSIRPKVKFETTIFRGHIHVVWSVDKRFTSSPIPIKYTVSFCPEKLNQGIFPCNISKVVCGAIYNGRTYSASIQQHPGNVTNYLSNYEYESVNDTIESPGSIVEGVWDAKRQQFSCGVFMHHCMDGQLGPWFAYHLEFNGTRTSEEIWGDINLSGGRPVKPENVTIGRPVRDGCCSFSVVVKWQIIHVCRVDVPSFKVWLMARNKTLSSTKISNDGLKLYSFEETFSGLPAQTEYTVHIESYKVLQANEDLNASYVKKTFRTPGIRANVKLNKVAIGGYVSFSWKMDDSFLEDRQDVVHNISWCPEGSNTGPLMCKNHTTLCKATYNGSSCHIQYYNDELRKYPDFLRVLNTSSEQPTSLVDGSWDHVNKQFTCKMFLNPCELDNYRLVVQYKAYSNGLSFKDYENTLFSYGFINQPNISISPSFTGQNIVQLTVDWSYDRVCAQEPSTTSTIWLSTTKNEEKKYIKNKGRDYRRTPLIQYTNVFHDLPPFTLYNIHIKGDRGEDVIKQFRTPEGVPTAAPVLDENTDNIDHCVGNKRNFTIRWQPPPEVKRNGIIRNNQVLYWKKSRPDEQMNVSLDNRTSYVLIDLECHEEYRVQVRACLSQITSCSDYSEAHYIPAAPTTEKSSKAKEFNKIFLWVSIGIAFLLIITASYVCQRVYHRRTREPLKPFDEGEVSGYSPPDDVELTMPGTYCFLVNDDEDV